MALRVGADELEALVATVGEDVDGYRDDATAVVLGGRE